MSAAAVWIESWSSSRVVAPSYRPLIVFVATRSASTSGNPPQRAAHGANDLVHVHRLRAAAALRHAHARLRRVFASLRCCRSPCVSISSQLSMSFSPRSAETHERRRLDGREKQRVHPISLPPRPPSWPRRISPGHGCRQVFGLSSVPAWCRCFYYPPASQLVEESVRIGEESFSITAAGQPRIHTGFPFKPELFARAPAWEPSRSSADRKSTTASCFSLRAARDARGYR